MSISLVSLAARLVHVRDGFNSWDTYTRRVEKALFVLLVLLVKFFVLEGGRKKTGVKKNYKYHCGSGWERGTDEDISDDIQQVLTTQWTRILRGIQKMRENTTTDPTMLSAKNFPREEEGGLIKRTSFLMLVDSYSSNYSPNVLMSSLSMKSHNRSITSWTCFMHFPCWKNDQTVPN